MNGAWQALFAHRVQPVGDCLEFQGCRLPSGYGKIGYESRVTTAHRVSWAVANNQPVPRGRRLVVRHSCDNPPCVNPAHLALGSGSDNSRDMIAKGRHRAATHPESYRRSALTASMARHPSGRVLGGGAA